MIGDDKRSVFDLPHTGRPLNNRVLVSVELTENKKSSSGLILGDASWDNAGHVTRHGMVVSTPSKFCYQGREGYGAEWDTGIEIECGDEVFWGLMAAWDCPVIKNDTGIFFLVKYDDLILKKTECAQWFPIDGDTYTNGNLFPLNGYVLCLPEYDERKMSTIELPSVQDKQRAAVVVVGYVNPEYFKDCGQDAVDVQVGDVITLYKPFLTAVEDERYAVLDKNLSYVQRRWIIAVNRK